MSFNGRLVFTLVLCMGSAIARADEPPPTTTATALADLDPDRLNRQLAELDVEHSTLEQALQTASATAGIPISVRWNEIEAAGVPRTTPIKLHLWKITFASALRVILGLAEMPDRPLTFEVRGPVVAISTASDLASTGEVRMYNVRDLLAAIQKRSGKGRQDAVDALSTLLIDAVEPDSWRDLGGKLGQVRELAGVLIVNQTHRNHETVTKVLRQARDAGGDLARVRAATQPTTQPQ